MADLEGVMRSKKNFSIMDTQMSGRASDLEGWSLVYCQSLVVLCDFYIIHSFFIKEKVRLGIKAPPKMPLNILRYK